MSFYYNRLGLVIALITALKEGDPCREVDRAIWASVLFTWSVAVDRGRYR